MESVYSKRIRAGKRRTYFFDVRATRSNDYYLTITESRKKFEGEGYDRHKIFLYKEDFNKFLKALGEAIDYVKTDLMPDFDFDAFNHEYNDAEGEGGEHQSHKHSQTEVAPMAAVASLEEIEAAEETPVVSINEPIVASVADASGGSNLASEEVDKW